MKLGFIGAGAISEAIILGLFNHGKFRSPVFVSRRSRVRSERLARQFRQVEVKDDNQDLVHESDFLVIAVLPGQCEQVLSALEFRADQTIVSLVAGTKLEDLRKVVAPATRVHRAVPMPPIEFGLGSIPLYPPNADVQALFDRVGTSLPLDDESHFGVFAAASAFMATFFEMVASNARWMEDQGIARKQAARYTTSLVQALAAMAAKADAEELQSLSSECQTAGGLNERLIKGCEANGWFEILRRELDGVVAMNQTL